MKELLKTIEDSLDEIKKQPLIDELKILLYASFFISFTKEFETYSKEGKNK